MLVSNSFATSRYENVQLQREYDDYFDEYIDLTLKISNIYKTNSIKDLRPIPEFNQSNHLIKDIKANLDKFLIATEDQKDTLLVDIGFELVQLNENINKLNKLLNLKD